jgi:hypothetical protein
MSRAFRLLLLKGALFTAVSGLAGAVGWWTYPEALARLDVPAWPAAMRRVCWGAGLFFLFLLWRAWQTLSSAVRLGFAVPSLGRYVIVCGLVAVGTALCFVAAFNWWGNRGAPRVPGWSGLLIGYLVMLGLCSVMLEIRLVILAWIHRAVAHEVDRVR